MKAPLTRSNETPDQRVAREIRELEETAAAAWAAVPAYARVTTKPKPHGSVALRFLEP